MEKHIQSLEGQFASITNGFKEMENQAKNDWQSNDPIRVLELAKSAYASKVYQVRMYGVFLFGHLSTNEAVLKLMKEEVSKDENWRVQEVLAKAFDQFCKLNGMENSLTTIDEWLRDMNPNIRRAVTEGLRIWTSREYFRENPKQAIERLASLRNDSSDYVRKSVGNALRDISKKFPDLIKVELDNWDVSSKEIQQVHKLASKFFEVEKVSDASRHKAKNNGIGN